MKPITRTIAAIALITLGFTVVSTNTYAQFGGGGGMHRGSGGGTRQQRDSSNQPSRPSLSDRLFQLRVRLSISPTQTPAWEHLYAAFMALQQPPRRSIAVSDANSAQQTMQQALSQAQDRYALVETLADALKQLDAQLDAQQKTTADELLPEIISDATRAPAGRDRGTTD